MALYRLNVFLANGKSIKPYQERIIKEMDESFAEGMNARNPKELKRRFYDEENDCIVAEMYSKAELSSPGHLLSNVSKRLLKSDEKICADLGNELLGNRLFKIDTEDISEHSKKVRLNMTNCRFLQIIASLLLEETDVKQRHLSEEVVQELKEVLVNNQYVVTKYRLEE